MAIVQISRIQHRTGKQSDLPQLAEGELGFATDSRRLFIGNDITQYPPGVGTTSQTEVLTQHSTIRFSQVDGSGKDLFIDTNVITDGQIIRFDEVSNKWILGGGDIEGNINLGVVENVKIKGGAGGFVIETDGSGNLSWGTKGYAASEVSSITKANPAVVTTTLPHYFINRTPVTITGVLGLLTPTAGTGTITASTSSATITGVSTSFGASYVGKSVFTSTDVLVGVIASVQSTTSATLYANAAVAMSGAAFSYGTSMVNGALCYAKIIDEYNFELYSDTTLTTTVNTSAVTISFLSDGRILGNVLPNTTGTGAAGGDYSVQFALGGVLSNTAAFKYSSAGVLSAPKFSGNGALLTNIAASAVTGTVTNAQTAVNAGIATIAGTVTASVQPNITSLGNLVSTRVLGNVFIGASGVANVPYSGSSTAYTPVLQVLGNTVATSSATFVRYGADADASAMIWVGKSRSATRGAYDVPVITGDALGHVSFGGSVGDKMLESAMIRSHATANASAGSLAGNLSFWTNDGNQASPLRRLTIDSSGNVTVHGNLSVAGSIAGSIQSAVTVTACSQPNITSVGVMTALNVSGMTTLDDLTVNGNTVTGNIASSTWIRAPKLQAGQELSGVAGSILVSPPNGSNWYWLDNPGTGTLRISGGTSPTDTNAATYSTSTGTFAAPKFYSTNESRFSIGDFADPKPGTSFGAKVSDGLAVAGDLYAVNRVQVSSAGASVPGQYEIVNGTGTTWYKTMIRHDGTDMYMLTSNATTSQSLAEAASWNTWRPWRMELSTGRVYIDGTGQGTWFGGQTFYGGDLKPSVTGVTNLGTATSKWASVVSKTYRADKGLPSAGEASAVGFSFASDGDTGLFASGSDSLQGSTVSVWNDSQERLRINSGVNGGNVAVLSTNTSTSTTTGALVVSGGLGVAGNIFNSGNVNTGGKITATGNVQAPNFIGNLVGSALSAQQLITPRNINGVAFDGTSDITIPGGYLIQTGKSFPLSWTSQVDDWGPSTSNYFDIFPPTGYAMNKLAGFTCSPAEFYYAGDVNYDDSMWCGYERLTDRIRVRIQATEQRYRPAANWLAIWSPVVVAVGGESSPTTLVYNSTIGTTLTHTQSLNANFDNTIVYNRGFTFASSTVVFTTYGGIIANGSMWAIANTANGKSWFYPTQDGIGKNYWVRASIVSSDAPSDNMVTGPFEKWVNLGTERAWQVVSRDSSFWGTTNKTTVVIKFDLSSDRLGSIIVASGRITLIAEV